MVYSIPCLGREGGTRGSVLSLPERRRSIPLNQTALAGVILGTSFATLRTSVAIFSGEVTVSYIFGGGVSSFVAQGQCGYDKRHGRQMSRVLGL